MSDNRMKKARERAGLSIGQAARLIGVASQVIMDAENSDVSEVSSGLTARMAEVYMVDPDWMLGVTPQYDRDAMKDAKGYDQLSTHDRDVIDEFAASLPKGNVASAREKLKGKT